MLLKNTDTEKNLMAAFAGESQARNRYTFAGEIAKKQNNQIAYLLFNYIAKQEEAHAKVFFDHLKNGGGNTIKITSDYPVDSGEDLASLMKQAESHELHEHDEVYKSFAKVAELEGFPKVSSSFKEIANIEKHHAQLLQEFYKKLDTGTLFKSVESEQWICTNCGYIYEGIEAPQACVVCNVPQTYFCLLSKSNFE